VVTLASPRAALSLPEAETLLARALATAPHLHGQVAVAEFHAALERSLASHFKKATPSAGEASRYLASLHHADLALAVACAEGQEAAWEHFVRTHRPDLYAAARAVARDANPHELADGIYAELFGLEEREGKRRSLFRYFHGRSKLSTWLRAIVAQRFVDQVRAARRTVSLGAGDAAEGDGEAPATTAAQRLPGNQAPPDPDRARLLAALQAALQAALGVLDARDRLRLAYYYVQDLTLAQIGRLLGEHEATVSRKLDRVRADLRKQVERTLRTERRLSDAQVKLCFDYARQEWPFDLTAPLAGPKGESARNRS
jgi:RNA polymerase sigma-70 factor (ECF subfamily)